MEIYNSFDEKKGNFSPTLLSDINTLKQELAKFNSITKVSSFGTPVTIRFFFRGVPIIAVPKFTAVYRDVVLKGIIRGRIFLCLNYQKRFLGDLIIV